MDQPPQQNNHAFSWDWLATTVILALTGIGSLWARSRIRVDGLRAKVRAESEPIIEREYLEENAKITASWQSEVDKLRAQIDKVREESRQELVTSRKEAMDWMQRALSCESRVPALMAEIETLKGRVHSLEEQLKKGHRTEAM